MPAYWVARSKINDSVEYKKYTDLVHGIIAKFGGKVSSFVHPIIEARMKAKVAELAAGPR